MQVLFSFVVFTSLLIDQFLVLPLCRLLYAAFDLGEFDTARGKKSGVALLSAVAARARAPPLLAVTAPGAVALPLVVTAGAVSLA